ncbi:hypothetical protein Kpol_1020p33 [Vanderwaltozyma polyspora DSM 70294]|uniref:1,3-beta-glucanosyltransferase n=1 Tax=Vanderwaltozyma polyspora (strain ATCC 22028 / DSM 70294 / BCRC 21397 / CBS 2163 / NBRC 10782 / NRRL Y-8283 / UCD 57-17) TaxID=436907 RepID=A7TLE3_VANPO|nr:uncharacterized protein Kpol_1020p33 [Vanderwaltozyma polyspora DSM 70294]EDO16924.1 hypothetical protein Kpol_1020p33 [Vanderwaltozyma polyspora DSM 70294]
MWNKRLRNTLFLIYLLNSYCSAYIHPIEIQGKKFVDSVTKEPFFIKGVDYQPGGSSEVNAKSDPLSDPSICARDIYMFQQLGINTIRIYSINPDLNHDACMTMLAAAGIYLLLDVNSPLPNQHLNRYEPWTTYNEGYINHVLKVTHKFSFYNNTLGFFAGNEIVNDKKSSKNAPPYIKSVINDMKTYSRKHLPRNIPIGYSAADDLNYRISLAKYLECSESSTSSDYSVDFYGINSYQWCGQQTIKTSGYDKLVEAYQNYSRPVLFSEFGCNLILPRQFEEIKALFSPDMYSTFSGGLVYEYSQEPNNYGLVMLSADGSAMMLSDFDMLKKQYANTITPNAKELENIWAQKLGKQSEVNKQPLCKAKYDNLSIETKVAKGLATKLIANGVKIDQGRYIQLNESDLQVQYEIYDLSGKQIDPSLTKVKVTHKVDTNSEDDDSSSKGNKLGAGTPNQSQGTSSNSNTNSNSNSNSRQKSAGSIHGFSYFALIITLLFQIYNS